MLEITNSRSSSKNPNQTSPGVSKKNPPRSAVLPPVKVGLDYRELAHRRVITSGIRPKTANSLVRNDNSTKLKKPGSLAVHGMSAPLHAEDSVLSTFRSFGSLPNDKSNHKLRNKLSYMCHEIEGSKSYDADGSYISSSLKDGLVIGEGKSVIEEIEQRHPFNQESIEDVGNSFDKGDRLVDSYILPVNYDDEMMDGEVVEKPAANASRSDSPSGHDPNRFFIDLWLKKYQEPIENSSTQSSNPAQLDQLETFHMDLLFRLQNAFTKAQYERNQAHQQYRRAKAQAASREGMNHRSTEKDYRDMQKKQLNSLKSVGIAALEIFEILIKEKGPMGLILPAIKDALLPLIFDNPDISQSDDNNLASVKDNPDGASDSTPPAESPSSSVHSTAQAASKIPKVLDYTQLSTYIEKYTRTHHYHSTLTNKYEQLLKEYLNVEILKDQFEQKSIYFQQNYDTTVERLQSVSARNQDLSASNEVKEMKIKELETALAKEQLMVLSLKEKVEEFESDYQLLKIEKHNVMKERQRFESEWSQLLIENDRLRRDNDNASRLKFELKRQLSEVSDKYHSILSKLNSLQTSFQQQYETDFVKKLCSLTENQWIEFNDKQSRRQSNSVPSPQANTPKADLVKHNNQISDQLSSLTSTLQPIYPSSGNIEELDSLQPVNSTATRKVSMINPGLTQRLSTVSLIQNISETINSESQELELFSRQLESNYHILDECYQFLASQRTNCRQVQAQYDSRVQDLLQEQLRLLAQHQQQMVELQQHHREEQKKSHQNSHEAQETLRKTIYQKEMDLATHQEIRKRHERQIERLTEDLIFRETQLDHCTEQRNRYEAIVYLAKEDCFYARQEENYERIIEAKDQKYSHLQENFNELQKELNLEMKEKERIRETSDRQIYLLMKEKEKAVREKNDLEVRVELIMQQGQEANQLSEERILFLVNELDSWRTVISHLRLLLSKEKSEVATQTIEVEKKDFDQQISTKILKEEIKGSSSAPSPTSRKSPEHSNKRKKSTKSQRTQRGKSKNRLSMHSISEVGEDNEETEKKDQSESEADSDSDLSNSDDEDSEEDERDSGSDSSTGDDNSHDNYEEEERKKKRKTRKQIKKQIRLKKLKEQLNSRRTTAILDPRLFTEERKKSILKQSVKNSILFDRDYIPVEANNFYENPDAVKEFVVTLKDKMKLFHQIKQDLVEEKQRVQHYLIEFQEAFFQEKELIIKELEKKVMIMKDVTIAEMLNQELQQVILHEQQSIAPEFIPDDVKEFTDETIQSFSKSMSGGVDTLERNTDGRHISFLLPTSTSSASFISPHSASSEVKDTDMKTTDPSPMNEVNPSPNSFRSTTRESMMISPTPPLTRMMSKSALAIGMKRASSSIQLTKSDDQIDKVIDIKALIKVSRRLSHFVYKKRKKSLSAAVTRSDSGVSAINSSSSEEEEDAAGDEDEALLVDGFESSDTLSAMKKQKKKRKTLKPKILIEIDPHAQASIEKKNKLRQFSHDRFYHASTQTTEDLGSWPSRNTPAPATRKRGIISHSVLIRSLSNNSASLAPSQQRSSESEDDHFSDDNQRGGNTGNSKLSRRLKSDTIFSELLSKYYSKEQISQPFLGFVRKHEKIYAREIGLMKIAIREYKRYYDNLKIEIEHLLALNGSSKEVTVILSHLQQSLQGNLWMFDPELFVRKVNNNPLEDCIDVSTQLRIIESYQEVLANRLIMNQENQELVKKQNKHLVEAMNHLNAAANVNVREDSVPSTTASSSIVLETPQAETLREDEMRDASNYHISSVQEVRKEGNPVMSEGSSASDRRKSKLEIASDRRASLIQEYTNFVDTSHESHSLSDQQHQQDTLYHLINHTIKDLLLDLTNRIKRSGGWRALLYRSDGSIDIDMDQRHFPLEEQILIQTEKISYLKMKLVQRDESSEKIILKLNKQNAELLQKILLLQKQSSHYQHPNYNNNLDKLAYYRGISSKNLSSGNLAGQKETGVNTEMSFLQDNQKIFTERDWKLLIKHIDLIQHRVEEMQKQVDLERQLRFEQQERLALLLFNIHNEENNNANNLDRKLVPLTQIDNNEDNRDLLKKSLQTPKKHLPLTDESSFLGEGLDQTQSQDRDDLMASSYVSDEDLSKYSKDIINDYLLSATDGLAVHEEAESQRNSPRDHGPSDGVKWSMALRPFEKMSGNNDRRQIKPTLESSPYSHHRTQSAGKRNNDLSNPFNRQETEYVPIIAPKIYSTKVNPRKSRPWSSTTWRQIEKNSKNLFNNGKLGQLLPIPSTYVVNEIPEENQTAKENSQDFETTNVLNQLSLISEMLEKAFSAGPKTSGNTAPPPKFKTGSLEEGVMSIPIQHDCNTKNKLIVSSSGTRKGFRESLNIDLQSDVANTTSQFSKSVATAEKSEEKVPTLSSLYLPEIEILDSSPRPTHPSEIVVYGVGESALEDRPLDNTDSRQAILFQEKNCNDIVASDSTTQPPLIRSATFYPPSFSIENSFIKPVASKLSKTNITDRENIYTKLYQQMFSVLEASDSRKRTNNLENQNKRSPSPSRPQSNLKSKSLMSPEMEFYVSVLNEKYQKHKQESDKLFRALCSFEQKYHGVDPGRLSIEKINHPGSEVMKTSSLEEQKEATDRYNRPLIKEPLLRPKTTPFLSNHEI